MTGRGRNGACARTCRSPSAPELSQAAASAAGAEAGDDLPPGQLRVTVTYLEMRAAPASPPGPPPRPDLLVRRVLRPGVEGYRFLYRSVGEPWLWHERCRLSDTDLAALLDGAGLEILVLTEGGRVAGFAEFDRRPAPDVKLAYFGLLPAYFGHGLGRWLLGHVLARAWASRPRRVLVNTCSFDHPAALPLYRRFGFEVVEEVVRQIRDPRLYGLLPEAAAPHIPLGAQPPGRRRRPALSG